MDQRTHSAAIAERPARARVVVAQTRRMMATEVSVQIAAEPAQVARAQAALAECFTWFAEVERRLSRFQPESEICALNRSAGRWFTASETLYTAVLVATEAAWASGGLFNPTLLRRIEALGYDRDFALLSHATCEPCEPHAPHAPHAPRAPGDAPHPSQAAQTMPEVDGWKGILFESARQRIRLPVGAALDLGGIAKGWAADVALERYCQPFAGALVNVGGDLRVHGGPQPGQPWSVGVRDPLDAAEAQAAPDAQPAETETWNRATLTFSRGALATSGAVRRWWRKDGARYHHLLDPRTGLPLPLWTSADATGDTGAEQMGREPRIATVTALAPTGAQAEVATKVALARGLPSALGEVERAWARWGAVGPKGACDAGVALVFTLSDGRILHSANLAAWLDSWGTETSPLPMLLNTPGAQPLALETPGTIGNDRIG